MVSRFEKFLAFAGLSALVAFGAGLIWFLRADMNADRVTFAKRYDVIREQGYKCGMLGFPKETCPYTSDWAKSVTDRETWLEGWADGKIQALWWHRGH